MIVMVFHWWLLKPSAWNFAAHGVQPAPMSPLYLLIKTPVNLLLGGSTAVLVFFVMSGTVLAVSFTEVDNKQYIPYALKRFCRIYLPYAVAVALSLIAMNLLQPRPIDTLSVWFNTYSWTHPITAGGFVNYVLMTNKDTTLDPAIWSLAYELRISLIFPVLLFFLGRWRLPGLIAVTALSVGAQLIEGFGVSGIGHQLLDTLKYLYLFAFGAAFYLSPVRVADGNARPKALFLVAWLIALVPIFLAIQISALNISTSAFLLSSLGAILVVALALSSNPISNQVLASGWATWLGKISYSLYLLHIPVLLTVVHLLYGDLPTSLLFASGSLAAIFLAWLMAITFERSSQRLGRWLARLYIHGRLRSMSEANAMATNLGLPIRDRDA